MKNNPLASINLYARLGVGFLYIYHGLVPKIIWLSPIEKQLVELSQLTISAEFISPISGGLEIILGLFIIFFRQWLYPIYIAALSLVVLLLYTAYVMPTLLIEAFNPVSTNILGIFLCYIVIYTQKYRNTDHH